MEDDLPPVQKEHLKSDGFFFVSRFPGAHFEFNRTRWGVIYGSSRFFRHLGMHLVFDLISLQLRIVTEPARR